MVAQTQAQPLLECPGCVVHTPPNSLGPHTIVWLNGCTVKAILDSKSTITLAQPLVLTQAHNPKWYCKGYLHACTRGGCRQGVGGGLVR